MEKVAVVDKWLNDMVVRQAERPKNVDPVFTSAEVSKKRDEIIFFATPILTKPKPKPPVIPTPGGSGTGTPKPQTPQPDADKQQKQEPPAQEAGKEGASGMDVD